MISVLVTPQGDQCELWSAYNFILLCLGLQHYFMHVEVAQNHKRAVGWVKSDMRYQRGEGAESHRRAEGEKLLKFSAWYLAFQLTINWIANFIFSSSVEISRSVYSVFSKLDDLTPALVRLKFAYHAPAGGREFSQVFAIYMFLFAVLCVYAIALVGFFVGKGFLSLQWKKMVARDYFLLSIISAIAAWEFYFFFAGTPTSLTSNRGFFGTGFINSMCLLLPFGQFTVLGTLSFYYMIDGNSRQRSSRPGDQ